MIVSQATPAHVYSPWMVQSSHFAFTRHMCFYHVWVLPTQKCQSYFAAGGGVRGIIANEIMAQITLRTNMQPRQVHILHDLHYLFTRLAHNILFCTLQMFDLICGVSTGSILSCLYGIVGMHVDRCREVYLEFPAQVFRQSKSAKVLGRKVYSLLYDEPPYKTKHLASTLQVYFHNIKLIESAHDPTYPKVPSFPPLVFNSVTWWHRKLTSRCTGGSGCQ